jgi:hypothetical protein
MVVFLPLFVAIAWMCHAQRWNFFAASVASTLLGTIAAWVLASSHFGWMDETFFRNLAFTSGLAFLVSIATGVVRQAWHATRRSDRKKDKSSKEQEGDKA